MNISGVTVSAIYFVNNKRRKESEDLIVSSKNSGKINNNIMKNLLNQENRKHDSIV